MNATRLSLDSKKAVVTSEAVVVLCTIFGAVAWFWLAKNAYMRTAVVAPHLVALAGFFAISPAMIAWRETYAGLSPAYTVLLRGLSLTLGFYAAVGYHLFPGDLTGTARILVALLPILQLVAVAASILALRHPVFALVPALYVLIAKDWTQYIFSLPSLTRTDYLPVVELAIFLPLCIAVPALFRRLPGAQRFADMEKGRLTALAFYLAVAIHFGNYFHSAVEKVILDGGSLSWILHNPTYLLLSNTMETKHLPIAHLSDLSAITYSWMKDNVVLLNLSTLVVQIYSLFAIANRRSLIVTTILYDLSHVAIFLVTGILFWKWILLNLIIVVAARRFEPADLTLSERLLGPVFVAGGVLVFFAARLGWYDTPMLTKAYFTATMMDGRTYEVPSNYFGAASVTVAQARMGSLGDSEWPTGTWGATQSFELLEKGLGCAVTSAFSEPAHRADAATIERFVRLNHRNVLQHTNSRGRFSYDLYPHHIWSNPALFRDFYAVDKRMIEKYTYVNEFMCVTFEHGRLAVETVRSDELDVYVN